MAENPPTTMSLLPGIHHLMPLRDVHHLLYPYQYIAQPGRTQVQLEVEETVMEPAS
jgi:hypothetical protein